MVGLDHRSHRSEGVLGGAVPADGVADPAAGEVAAGLGEEQPGVAGDDAPGQHLDPRPRLRPHHLPPVPQQPPDGLVVAGPGVGPDGVGVGGRVLQHLPRPAVAGRRLRFPHLGLEDRLQVRPQHLVIAEAAVVEGDQQELAGLDLLQQLLAAGAPEEGVTEGSVQAGEDARVEQEPAQLVGQLLQDVLGQVLPNQAGPGGQGAQRLPAAGRGLAGGGQVEQLQHRRPPLGAAGDLGRLLRGQRRAVDVLEQPLHLPGPEAQVVGTHLREPALQASPGEVQPGLAAGGEQDHEGFGGVLHQPGHEVLGGRALQRVEVVDHQDGPPARPSLDVGDHGVERSPPAREAGQRGGESPLEVGQQGLDAAVGLVGPVPGRGGADLGQELGQDGGLARAGGSDHDAEAGAEGLPQPLGQPGPDQARGRGGSQLG